MWPKVANNMRGATFFSAIIVLEELKFRVSGCRSEKKKNCLKWNQHQKVEMRAWEMEKAQELNMLEFMNYSYMKITLFINSSVI